MLSIGRRTRRIGTFAALGGALIGLIGGLFTTAPAFAALVEEARFAKLLVEARARERAFLERPAAPPVAGHA